MAIKKYTEMIKNGDNEIWIHRYYSINQFLDSFLSDYHNGDSIGLFVDVKNSLYSLSYKILGENEVNFYAESSSLKSEIDEIKEGIFQGKIMMPDRFGRIFQIFYCFDDFERVVLGIASEIKPWMSERHTLNYFGERIINVIFELPDKNEYYASQGSNIDNLLKSIDEYHVRNLNREYEMIKRTAN